MKGEKEFTKAFKTVKSTLERNFMQYFYPKNNLSGRAIPCGNKRSTKREP